MNGSQKKGGAFAWGPATKKSKFVQGLPKVIVNLRDMSKLWVKNNGMKNSKKCKTKNFFMFWHLHLM